MRVMDLPHWRGYFGRSSTCHPPLSAELTVMTKGLVVLAALAAMTACASAEKKAEKADASSMKADMNYCNDLAGLASSIAAYTTLDSTSSVADLKKASESMEAAYAKVQDATTKMDKAEAKALVAAHTAYTSAVQGIPGSTTLGAAASQVQSAYAEYQARVQGLTGVECVAAGSAN
jgi:hypothetical protein